MATRQWLPNTIMAVLLGSTPTSAGTIHVPGDYPTLNGAVAAAVTDDVIVVHGGVHPPVLVDKPLTLIGEPVFTIDNSSGQFGKPYPPMMPSFILYGPGSGRVTIARAITTGKGNVFHFTGSYDPYTESGISGSGFDELYVLDSKIEPCQWNIADSYGFDGVSAISTSVPYVHVSRSEVIGGHGYREDCFFDKSSFPASKAAPAIAAAFSTVVILDSTVKGGDSAYWCFGSGQYECPTLPHPKVTGGANGVFAKTLMASNSLIVGGKGSDVVCNDTNPGTILGTTPPGVPWVVNEYIPLPGNFFSLNPIVIGQSWTFTWSDHEPYSLAVLSTPVPPVSSSLGWTFLNLSSIVLFPLDPSPPMTIPVPSIPALTGRPVAMQLYWQYSGFSRPYVGVILP